jgi:hypothetical protein
MRSMKWGLATALMAALVYAGVGLSQQGGPADGPPRGGMQPVPLSVEDIVERIMSFDKNGDGKVTRDELPERLHGLITRGDLNKDGALDRDEIRKLATAPGGVGFGFGVRGGFGGFAQGGVTSGPMGPGPLGPLGPGPGPMVAGAGPLGPGLARIEGVVDDLKLPGPKKERATAVVKTHQQQVRKLMDQARAELLQKMQEVLSEEEFKDFKAALDRPGVGETIINVGPVGVGRPGEVERKLEQLPRDR